MALPQVKMSPQWQTDPARYPGIPPTHEMTDNSISENLFWEVFGKVEQAKQEWEATLDALPQLICLVDSAGQILRANRTLESWKLGKVHSVKGRDLHRLLHPRCVESPCQLDAFLQRSLAANQSDEIELDDRQLHRYLQIRTRPIQDRRRITEPITVFILQDITQRKAAEVQLQQTNEALKRAVQAKQEMLQNVSHELRTPLALILGYTHLLRDETLGTLNEDQHEALAILSQRSQYLQEMIERLLLLQTIEKTQIRPVDCDPLALVRQSVDEWETRATEQGIALTIIAPRGDLPHLHGDPLLIRQVIGNLLENAIKFSPGRTAVTLCLETKDQEIVIAIQDQGIGIPLEQQAQIFDNFHQLNGSSTRAFGGMGIGLALCQKIVQAHKGRLWMESAGAGQGSTFYVALMKSPVDSSPGN